MPRFLLLSNQQGLNKEKTETVLYVKLWKLPVRATSQDGTFKTYYPKTGEELVNKVISASTDPMLFNDLKELLPGTLIDGNYDVNQSSGKSFIKDLYKVSASDVFTIDDVYLLTKNY